METQIFHQVKAEYAFHYDKRCRLEGKNKAKHNLCLGPNHFLCDYLKVLYKLLNFNSLVSRNSSPYLQ